MSIDEVADMTKLSNEEIAHLREILEKVHRDSLTFRYETSAATADDIQDGEIVVYDDDAGTRGINVRTPEGNVIDVGETATINPSVRAHRPTNQTGVTTATWIIVNINTEDWDKGGNFNTTSHLFTAPSDGQYQVNGAVTMDVGDGKMLGVGIYVNTGGGLTAHTQWTGRAGSAGNIRQGVGDTLDLSTGDTVALYVYHTIGANGTVVGATNSTYISITKLP